MKYKIFIINLDSSTARWDACKRQFGNAKIERISAIEGAMLSENELTKHFDYELNKLQYHKTLTSGEIGCYHSHQLVWKRIVDEQLDFAIVLEDDFVLNEGMDELLTSLAHISVPWDYIKLSESPEKRKEIASFAVNQFRMVSYNKIPAGTVAQAVSLNGAYKLLRASESFGRPVDIDLQYWWENQIKVFGFKPYAFKSNQTFKSDIDSNIEKNLAGRFFSRKQAHNRPFSKIIQQLYFYTENSRAIRAIPPQSRYYKKHEV